MNGPLFNLIGGFLFLVVPFLFFLFAWKLRDQINQTEEPSAFGIAGAVSGIIGIFFLVFAIALIVTAWDNYAIYLGGFPK